MMIPIWMLTKSMCEVIKDLDDFTLFLEDRGCTREVL
jgi:hypothetical protein